MSPEQREFVSLQVRLSDDGQFVEVSVYRTQWEGVADMGEAVEAGAEFEHAAAQRGVGGAIVWVPVGLFDLDVRLLLRVAVSVWDEGASPAVEGGSDDSP